MSRIRKPWFIPHWLDCPQCGVYYHSHIEKFYGWPPAGKNGLPANSGLGPTLVQCSSCGHIFASEWIEWPLMNTKRRRRLYVLTVIYSLFVGLCLSIPTLNIVNRLQPGAGTNHFSASYWVISITAYTLMMCGLQWVRVRESCRRFANPDRKPVPVSFYDWKINFQFWGEGTAIVGLGLAYLLAYVIK